MAVVVAPKAEPVQLDPDTKIDIGYDRWLVPWTPERDCRPKTKTPRWLDPHWAVGGPARGPSGYVGSARHGECTWCARDTHELHPATYRMVNKRGSTSASICERCARKLIGGPVRVPRFSSPEEAQAWLDANGD